MQLTNEAQFLKLTFWPTLFVSASTAARFRTFIVPLTSIYASL